MALVDILGEVFVYLINVVLEDEDDEVGDQAELEVVERRALVLMRQGLSVHVDLEQGLEVLLQILLEGDLLDVAVDEVAQGVEERLGEHDVGDVDVLDEVEELYGDLVVELVVLAHAALKRYLWKNSMSKRFTK